MNTILSLKDDNGLVHLEEGAKANVAVTYFMGLFLSNQPLVHEFILSLGLQKKVNDRINTCLAATVTRKEIKDATFLTGSYQSPGIDGFTGIFFQAFWDVVGESHCDAALSFFQTERLLHNFNHTLITLIPKTPNAKTMKQMRPTGLCQVFYKIIAKILADRLSCFLPLIVGPNQNGFVKDRSITDNIPIGQEVMQFLKTKTQGREKWMALKLDMEKAYDRVEWPLLFELLKGLGFGDKWLKWLRSCVTTVSFYIVLNGSIHGYFHPQRGLRQGDPLSPLLFAIYTEAFSSLIENFIRNSSLHGLRIHREAPLISHLFFADNSYLFLRASSTECVRLIEILHEYEVVSGQRVNLQKSVVTFSANVLELEATRLAGLLGVSAIGVHDRYLGLPSQVHRSKIQTFRYIEDSLANRIRHWKSKNMSLAAKEVVIKAVGTATPVFAMSCFRLTSNLCRRMNEQLSTFWWAGQDK
ncbi:unnamed protein product [Linum trigynum]|uniref:Reverse transcriptase domain-containing protein n=1 Tax=Linum trigynum TaxID=586398 RepID=A0AAV2CIT9_9ROSI